MFNRHFKAICPELSPKQHTYTYTIHTCMFMCVYKKKACVCVCVYIYIFFFEKICLLTFILVHGIHLIPKVELIIWDFIMYSFVDYDGYFISSKGFLPTVVDIMVIKLNSPIPVHFSFLIPKISVFTLVISCLTTSNLPWFMDLKFQVPM